MESFAYYVLTTTDRFGRPYRSGMADVPWFSKAEVFPEAKDDVYWYLHIDKATDEQNVKEKAAREAKSGMTREGSIPGEMALIN